MKQNDANLHELISYYRRQGAPEDQQALIMLLKETQHLCGGAVSSHALTEIAEAYRLKSSVLQALIRRIPSLYAESAPHHLEICGSCAQSAAIAKFIEERYAVQNGEVSEKGRFFFRVTGCMKNCRQGPSVRWDGQIISRVSTDSLHRMIEENALTGA